MGDDHWTAADDAVEEIRESRRRLWARFDDDPTKMLTYLQDLHHELIRQGWKEAPPPPARE